MALKDIFNMIKADRYTADGREQVIKAQEAETEDRTYQIGEISQKTGLQKTANGWVKPKKGNAGAGKKEHVRFSNPDTLSNIKKMSNGEIEKGISMMEKVQENPKFSERQQKLASHFVTEYKRELAKRSEIAKQTESKPSTIKFEDAEKAIENGQVVQWQDRDGNWNDVDPKTSELVMARDIGSKLRIKTDAGGNPVKQKPEPSMNETRSKLLELEKRRKKFEKYPDMDNNIRLEQAALLSKAGFESRAAFEDFVKSKMPNDSAPRILTGDTKIRVRKA